MNYRVKLLVEILILIIISACYYKPGTPSYQINDAYNYSYEIIKGDMIKVYFYPTAKWLSDENQVRSTYVILWSINKKGKWKNKNLKYKVKSNGTIEVQFFQPKDEFYVLLRRRVKNPQDYISHAININVYCTMRCGDCSYNQNNRGLDSP